MGGICVMSHDCIEVATRWAHLSFANSANVTSLVILDHFSEAYYCCHEQ